MEKIYVCVMKPNKVGAINSDDYFNDFKEENVKLTLGTEDFEELKIIISEYAPAENGYGLYFKNKDGKLLNVEELVNLGIIEEEETYNNVKFYCYTFKPISGFITTKDVIENK